MPVTEILFSANYLPIPDADAIFSQDATHRMLVLVCLGFSQPIKVSLEWCLLG